MTPAPLGCRKKLSEAAEEGAELGCWALLKAAGRSSLARREGALGNQLGKREGVAHASEPEPERSANSPAGTGCRMELQRARDRASRKHCRIALPP